MRKENLASLFGVFLFGALTFAQVTTGTISGTVKDSTGAVLPGGKIVLRNQETGISRTVQTDAAGRYLASSLSLGNYEVTATLEGFQTVVRSGIVLTVGREAVVDLTLSVGAVTQTVEVTGEAPAIETTTATISGFVNAERIRELPLNGRSFVELALLSPGILMNRTTGNSPSDGFGQRLSVNGSRADSNLFLLDGTVANDTANNSSTVGGLSLGVEGVREFRVITHNFSAEYGRKSGAVVSVVTRSGTNQFHGSVYEFVRNNKLDARDFFNLGDLPPFRRNQFGASAGGPVIRDRIFFFANYEGLRQRQGIPIVATVPDVNARQGILPCPPKVRPDGTVVNFTGFQAPCNTAGTSTYTVAVSSSIRPYLNLFPLPNSSVNFGDGTARYIQDFAQPVTEDYALERMDFRLSDKDNFYWRYIFNPSNRVTPRPVPLFVTPDEGTHHYASLSETHIFSGTAINDFRFAFSRTLNFGNATSLKELDPSLSFVPGEQMGTLRFSGVNFIVGLLSELGNNRNRPFSFLQNLFQAADSFSLVRGAHSLKFGVDMERSQINTVRGSNFRGVWDFDSLENLLLARPTRLMGAVVGGTSTRERGWRRTLVGWFIQDDYRLSPRLTLNLGLRHEFITTPTEVNGRSADLRQITDPESTLGPAFESAKLNFAPRVGLAWAPTGSGKTSIRAGAGVYHNQIDSLEGLRDDSRFYSGFTIRNPTAFPRVPPSAPLAAQSTLNNQFHMPTPTSIHYSLDVQRQVTPTMNLRLGYVGSYGYNMTRITNEDIRVAQIRLDGSKFFAANAPFINPNYSSIEMLRADVHDNYNGFQGMLQKTLSSGLVFQASYSLSKALSISDASRNRSIDNAGTYGTMDKDDPERDYGRSGYDQRQTFVFNSQYRMPWDHLLNSGLSKALFGGWAINGIWQYGSGMPLNASLGFNNSQNGDPLAPDRPNLAPGARNNPTHGATAGCGGVIPAGQKLRTPDRWYDPCAFVLPEPGTYGNLGRNTMAGPSFNQVNFTLVKNTAIREGKNLEFRAEFFNLFNHPSFGLPQIQVFDSTRRHGGNEGVVAYTTSQGRQIQLGLKFTF